MIPYFLRHYSGWVSHFHIFDNGSTDDSLSLLAGDPRISVEPFATAEDGFVATARRLMNGVWTRSRAADWVVTAEMDEHLHHPDLPSYLKYCKTEGVTALRAVGFDMLADSFPAGPQPLYQQIARGVRAFSGDKVAIFDPQAIDAINYDVGRHWAAPTGRVVWERHSQVKLLHYKNLGVDYVVERNEVLAAGLRARDREERLGTHYLQTRAQVERDFEGYAQRARRVPGLATQSCPLDEPTFEDELAIIKHSGLFDLDYYLATNPDVEASKIPALEHFCIFGWREGRRPNRLFDPKWYASNYAVGRPGKNNVLLDYILHGEAQQRRPSAIFDPAIYRDVHSILPSQPALLHALNNHKALSQKVETRGWPVDLANL